MNIDEIIREISSIKASSDDLAFMVGVANTNLANQSTVITSLVQGSKTGQDAVMTLSAAARSLSNAASSMRQLSRTCDECVQNLKK